MTSRHDLIEEVINDTLWTVLKAGDFAATRWSRPGSSASRIGGR